MTGGAEASAMTLRDPDFLRASVDWTWETDASLRIMRLSGHVAAITGQASLAHAGRPLGQLGRLADGPLTRQPPPTSPFRDQFISIETSGGPRHYRLSGTPLIGPDGSLTGYRGSAREADHVAPPSRDGFLAGVGREFRDPLTAMIGLAEAMSREADGPLAPRYADYARDIVGAGRHLLSFVDGMFRSSGSDVGRLEIAPVIAGEVLAQAVAIVGLAAEAKRLVLDLPPKSGVMVLGDERAVCQILVNLLGNAAKFTPDGGRIVVRVTPVETARQVEIAVQDSGPGIAEADQERIFGKFERAVQAGGAAHAEGLGLGLHISRDLAERMRGELTVASRPGQGARFALRLPAA